MLYNPENWQLIGNRWAVDQLNLALNQGRFRHAYLISGPPQIGKTHMAIEMAMALNCTASDNRPCGECRPCKLMAGRKHADLNIVEAERVGGTLKIEQIRELQHIVALRPYEARFRVVVIRRFHEAHPAASNALLKTLEEPPKNVVLIVLTDNLYATLPTILSRCQKYPLNTLSLEVIAEALQQRHVAQDRAELLAHLSGGRIGWAIQMAENEDLMQQRTAYIELLETLLRANRRERFRAVEDMGKDKSELAAMLQLWQAYWRDVFLLANGAGDRWITNIDRLKAMKLLLAQYPAQRFQVALVATRQALEYLDHNVNARLALEAMLLDYPRGRLM